MDQSIFPYIWRHSRREQLTVLMIVLFSLPFYFMSLSLPKTIVNQAIEGKSFEQADDTAPALKVELPFPDAWSNGTGSLVIFEGFQLQQVDYLFAMSFVFLALVCINGLFKFQVNTMKGRMGERLLRRLRYQLIDRVLRFHPTQFRRVKQSEVASMVTSEVEPLGGFIGDAYVQPAFLGGQALTALLFIVVQSVWLGMVAISVILIQSFLIPRMRAPILQLGKQRQLAARDLAGKVGEIVDGASAIHAHDTSNYERAEITHRLGIIYRIRYEIYRRKFFVKFLNNFLGQFTPFLFYIIGGYFAIMGSMDVGSVVAALLAYNQLPAPVRELINWDQQRMDVQIKYEQVIQQFNPDNILDEDLQQPPAGPTVPLSGDLVFANVSVVDDSGARLLDHVSFTVPLEQSVAVVGDSGSGKEFIGMTIARLLDPSTGRVTIGDEDVMRLPESVTGRRIGYSDHDAFVFPGSLRDNVLYGLKHQPVKPAADDPADRRLRQFEQQEIEHSGNAPYDIAAEWVDYDALGLSTDDDVDQKILDVFQIVDLADDVFAYGLRGIITVEENNHLADLILEARHRLRSKMEDSQISQLIEPFDPDRYNRNATVAQNLLFGTPLDERFKTEALATNDYMLDTIKNAGLEQILIDMGYELAETMVELFRDIPPDHPFFDQFSFIAADDLPLYQELLMRTVQTGGKVNLNALSEEDHERFLTLPFNYIEARHRLDLVGEDLQPKLLAARDLFRRNLPEDMKDAVAFFEPDTYNRAATIQDNVLMGRIAYGQPRAQEQVRMHARHILRELGLELEIFRVGLGFQVGSAGRRLTGAQRQKLGLARAMIKNPDYLVVNLALAALDQGSQSKILQQVLSARDGKGVLWVVARPSVSIEFDRVLVMEAGQLIEQGVPEDLAQRKSEFGKLKAYG